MKIGIYGLGGFGTFWAKELIKAGYEVIATSRSPKEIDGLTIVGYETFCNESDIIFICSSISSFDAVIENMDKHIDEKTIIADTCSVKLHPLEVMQKYLSAGQFVATHPMFGPQSGANGIAGLPIVLDALGNDDNKKVFEDMFNAMELKIVPMTCDEHDRQVAFSQALVHFLGRSLGKMKLPEIDIATYGYNNLLVLIQYIENNSIELFHNLQTYNPYASEMREKLLETITETKNNVDSL
jgi:prephenate dehydrogenase